MATIRLACLLACSAAPLGAQAPIDARPLTVDWIMRGPELTGREPTDVRWSADGRHLYFRWLAPGASWREPLAPYRVEAKAGAVPERLTAARWDDDGPRFADGPRSPDGRRKAVAWLGDLWLVTFGSGAVQRLTDTPVVNEGNPQWSADGRALFFVRDRNAFAFDLSALKVTQLTDLRPPKADADTGKTAQRAFLAGEERRLLATVRDRLWQDSVAKAEREARERRRLQPAYLGKDEEVRSILVAPSGRAALVVVRQKATKPRETRVPVFIAADGYVTDSVVRTKVGDAQDGTRVGLVRFDTTGVRWLAVTDSGVKPSSIDAVEWNADGSSALVMTQTADFKTRLLHRVDTDGRLVELDRLRDSAWVGGPCVGCAGFVPGTARAWFVSEADGYAHLYSVALDGTDRRQLTRGAWELLDVPRAARGNCSTST